MNCPKCGSKTRVHSSTYSPDDVVLYRKLKCISCDYRFYTAEVEIEFNSTLKDNLKRCEPTKRRNAAARWVKVRCLDTGEIFESASEAARSINRDRSSIINCCAGKRKTSGGKRWGYYKEEEVKEDES